MACVKAATIALLWRPSVQPLLDSLRQVDRNKTSERTSRTGPLLIPYRRLHRSCIAQAQPSKKGPDKTVKVYCAKCQEQLYKYKKGGKGSLVKCFVERIVEDATAGDLKCPQCGTEFARPAMIRGKPANKIIGGKVTMSK